VYVYSVQGIIIQALASTDSYTTDCLRYHASRRGYATAV